MKTSIRLLLASLMLGLLLGPAASLAQSPVGALAGNAVEGDIAVIRNPVNGFSREVKVGKSGRYQARNLPVARYEVVIRHADGSQDAARVVDVHIGITTRVQ
jgi:hypothetical protein